MAARIKSGRVLVATVLLVSLFGVPAQASVPELYQRVAGQHQIPSTLLFALALQESRRAVIVGGRNKVLPWPWTVNHRGKPYFFHKKGQAIAFAQILIGRGDFMFDVGLGQVNWRYHRQRFTSIAAAFTPETNLNVAATILREQYERKECRTWALAIGCYHRPGQRESDKRIARNYARGVISLWAKI